MSDFFSNEIVQGVLATFVVVLILGLFGWLKFRRDEKIVIEFLKHSGVETGDAAGTPDAISSATELSRTRVHRICSKSSRIKEHGKEKGSWTLS
jgi:hypothetical protein